MKTQKSCCDKSRSEFRRKVFDGMPVRRVDVVNKLFMCYINWGLYQRV